jgi:hypothetical protein
MMNYEQLKAKYHSLLATIAESIRDRDVVEIGSAVWNSSHQKAAEASISANAVRRSLARNKETRYLDWRTQSDKELMLLGYI